MSIGLDAPWLLLLLLVAPLAWAGRARPLVRGLFVLAVACLVVAASGPWVGLPRQPHVAVLVDISPSTRTAGWRDSAEVRRLVADLRERADVDVYTFADGVAAVELTAYDGITADVDTTRASTPADADLSILLTDGRLDPTPLGPVAFLLDPALDEPGDVRVAELSYYGDRAAGVATAAMTVENGNASVAGGDAWPENDALSLPPPAPLSGPRLWSSEGPAPPTFEAFDPSLLPAATTVATDAPPTEALQRWAVERGGLLILNGPEAIDATASPLSIRPPRPDARWTILLDASGSMSGQLAAAQTAVRRAGAVLPSETQVAVVAFASGVTPLFDGTAEAMANETFAGVAASGPTNLAAALQAAARRGGDVLAITDGGATEFAAEAAALAGNGQRLHVLLVSDADATELRDKALATGGTFAAANDPAAWTSSIEDAFEAGDASDIQQGDAVVRLLDPLAEIGTVPVDRWRRAWPRDGAVVTADGEASVALWRRGVGEIVASSAELPAEVVVAIANRRAVATNAEVEWQDGPGLVATVYAPLDADVRLHRDGVVVRATLVRPGEWQASVEGRREPAVATVTIDGRLAGRRATASRYAPEFEAVGNDIARMRSLGQVAANASDIELPRVYRRFGLTVAFAILGGAATAFALVFWTRRPATPASPTGR